MEALARLSWYWIAIGSAALTLLATLVYLNWVGQEKRLEEILPRLYETDDAEFKRSMSALLGPPFLGGNAVETLLNGDRIFGAMLAGIRSAQITICFESFIYWSGTIGDEFVSALCERARAGVRVHVLLDWVGSIKMAQELVTAMEDAGVEVVRFHQPTWRNASKLNNRTHRKLLIIDGKVGFTGGVGIADQWRGDARTPDEWRDTHYRVRGPVVAQMQAVFLDNWIRATGRVLHGEDYFPALSPCGNLSAQMFSSSPSGGSESMHLMYLLTITAARHSIDLANSYFVPDEMTIKTLIDAARRGVKVRILMPGVHIDSKTVRYASRAHWDRLLAAGIEVAEYSPTMFHVKALAVDELIASVGSTNFDNRSFRLNDEANLNVMNTAFAVEQHAVFDEDWAKAERITLSEWRRRPLKERLLERLANLLRSQV